MGKEVNILRQYIAKQGLRSTMQRESILQIFLSVKKHISIDELYLIVKRKYKNIGHTTVYRAIKLFLLLGICNEVSIGYGLVKYEHISGNKHHDHLICNSCGALIEIYNPALEKLKEKVAISKGFLPQSHKLEFFGKCRACVLKKT